MLYELTAEYHLHPIVDHFTIGLLACGIAAELLAAVAILLSRGGTGWLGTWSLKARSTSLLLMSGGAAAAVLSYFTGDIEADRLWDTMSPAAQQILASTDGAGRYLSHTVLGQYLMYAFLILAAWRVLLEFSAPLIRWRIAFLIAGSLAVAALLYQGKTGGELVYERGVGVAAASADSQKEGDVTTIPNPGEERNALADSVPGGTLLPDGGKR
ncbi:MAG: DUF2231 domain-containing protein [Deltaproteobacteria bacterium]